MRRFKKIIKIIISVFMIIAILPNWNKKVISASKSREKPVKVAVFLVDFRYEFISKFGEDLKDIQKENEGKVEFTFYDGKTNQVIQNESIYKVLKEGVDLILLNIVNREDSRAVIDIIKETNTPVIMFNREPLTPNIIQSYSKALYIGTDAKQAGILQGKMLSDTWNNSKQFIDKNRDNIMQYVMLEGPSNDREAIERTKYSVLTIENAGIKTQLLALKVCNWFEDLAYEAIKSLFLKYGNKIEVIIANNDSMAIGAIKALQEYGYNKGDKSKTIPVVGVDAISGAIDLIEKGEMLGSVVQGTRAYAEALYICGMNLVVGKSPIEGTEYKLDDTGVAIRLPISEYVYKNMFS